MPALSEALVPTERDVIVAKESQRQMGGMKFGRKESVAVRIGGKEIAMPVGVIRMMIAAVARLAEGKAVAMMPVDEEVSPQDAAEILNVSRPYAARLFDEGAIPSHRVGTHRRALTADVLAYKQRRKEARLKALDELAAEGQRLKMGY